MVRQVTSTIATRVIIALMSLLTTMIAGHRLGAHGLGDISLIVLGITFIMLPGNLVGGSTLVYLLPRVPMARVLRPSYAWAFICTLLAYLVIRAIPMVPDQYRLATAALAGLQCFYSIHLSVLLGQERLRAFNLISIVQALVQLVVFALLTRTGRMPDAMPYVYASFASFGATLVLSSIALISHPKRPHSNEAIDVLPFMLKKGAVIQVTNALQLLNYRMSYVMIEAYRNTSALGVYSVGNQLAESAWLAPRGLGTVVFSKVSNTSEPGRQSALAIALGKMSVLAALAVILVAVALPEALIQRLFGEEIIGLRPIMLLLSPGILAMAASQAISHYFSGTGRYSINLIGSGIGVLATLVGGYFLIPRFGLLGAAATASMAYTASVIFQTIVFLRITHTRVRHLLPTSSDVREVMAALRIGAK